MASVEAAMEVFDAELEEGFEDEFELEGEVRDIDFDDEELFN